MLALSPITSLLEQEKYRQNILQDEARTDRLCSIAESLGNMSQSCRIAVCIPAYRESSLMRNTLENYTIHQVASDGTPLDPELFEINILINSPHRNSVRDIVMFEVIEEFCADYPQYRINVAEVVYDFPDKAVMGLIFKDIADAVIHRNLSRDVTDEEKSRLILRTAGADVEALNPLLLSRTLRIFSDTAIVAHRGETRLPPQLLESFPLLHVMQTFAVYLLRQFKGKQTTNGPFSYTAEAYAAVDGFDPGMKISEEVDLANRIFLYSRESKEDLVFFCDDVKDVINNPRRQVHALFGGIGMAGRYRDFGTLQNEEKVHSMSLSWRDICSELLPHSCLLTPENLSREVSGYYRTYLRIAVGKKIPLETIDVIFGRWFELCHITEYSTHRSSFMCDNRIEIHNLDGLLELLEEQNF